MIIEFFKDNGKDISHFHLTAQNEYEQQVLDKLQGHFMVCREPDQPKLVGMRQLVYRHAQGEAHGFIFSGFTK